MKLLSVERALWKIEEVQRLGFDSEISWAGWLNQCLFSRLF